MNVIKILFLILLAAQVVHAQADTYLNVSINDKIEVNYPPDTRFILEDQDGKTVLYYDKLVELETYEVTAPMKLYVFHQWKSGPDVWKMETGTMRLLSQPVSLNIEEVQSERVAQEIVEQSQKVKLIRKRIIQNNSRDNDVSLQFSNGIIFYLKDGQAKAWLNGEPLDINGRYMIQSPEGVLKLSYNPNSYKVWYVMDDH